MSRYASITKCTALLAKPTEWINPTKVSVTGPAAALLSLKTYLFFGS